ncbi:YolD-like family protein [Cytobacillus firmus]|uniref:YolD-like family protein n=1 Tax=Cytobacillus firmus TaxID=1399 RepID=UPI0034A2EA5D
MLNDRGINKKWQGFFMPEHIAMLKKAKEDYHKKPRPILSDEQIEDIEQSIINSLQSNNLLEISTWKNGFFTSRVGVVTRLNPISKTIQFKDELDQIITIDFFQIVSVKVIS